MNINILIINSPTYINITTIEDNQEFIIFEMRFYIDKSNFLCAIWNLWIQSTALIEPISFAEKKSHNYIADYCLHAQ